MHVDQINKANLPKHIAIIMDGNGRWAKKKGAKRIFGHKSAIKAVRESAEACAELGVAYLTLYAFSTENWNRPKIEVDALMELLILTISNETETLIKNNIRLNTIGAIEKLPRGCIHKLQEAKRATHNNNGMVLNLALNYSGRWEITEMVKKIATKVEQGTVSPSEIQQEDIQQYLETAEMPDPELLIRTSGELRISNFLLWQIAYTELFITEILWPDFRKEHLYGAIYAYQHRERRFGKTSEQIKI